MNLARKLWDSHVMQTRAAKRLRATGALSDAGRLGNWRRWHRDQAIVELIPMAERIARDVRWMFAPHLDIRDLVQAGCVGLVKAAAAYRPDKGQFEPYAYFRVRGAIIDSQKRRTYREEGHVSLQAIADAHDGWLPPRLDTDRTPLPDAAAEQAEIARLLAVAILSLPAAERIAIEGHLAGWPLAKTAKRLGRSLTWTRAKLAEARGLVGVVVRGA